jgi:hypothetical protein
MGAQEIKASKWIASLIQAAKRRARGYRTTHNLVAIAYLFAGKVDFATHTR